MQGIAEGSAAIAQDDQLVIAQMRIARCAGHTTIGHYAADHHCLDASFAQHPIELSVEKSGVGYFAHDQINAILKLGHIGLA